METCFFYLRFLMTDFSIAPVAMTDAAFFQRPSCALQSFELDAVFWVAAWRDGMRAVVAGRAVQAAMPLG